ncbi:MAG: Tab2/Atab2 family RNA-binding protein [Cyanobacteria bacterium P01_H01_bin.119]
MTTVWELDFYSRPIFDERDKKRWEVLICEGVQSVNDKPESGFRYSKFLSSTEVNSIELQNAIADAIKQAPNSPDRIRYFRYPMQNMIARACEEMGIPARLSRRTFALQTWLDQRSQDVYPQEPGYRKTITPRVSAPPPSPKPLPDALVGQQWAVVTLEASAFDDMAEWQIDFGEGFSLQMAGLEPTAKVPGILIFSNRALPLAAWMSGLELAAVQADLAARQPQLLLETGAIDSWTLALLATDKLKTEAQNFEAAKETSNQVHFIAVQSDPESESFTGFWLLKSQAFG